MTGNSSPGLVNLTVSGNSGRGITCSSNSNPCLENVTISDNNDGGISCGFSNPTFRNVTITGNSVSGIHPYGGGIWCHYSNPILQNVTITGNSVSEYGGGIYCMQSSPSLENVTISGNSTSVWGGGIACHESSPSLENVIIIDNFAGLSGGGIHCQYSSNPSLKNVTMSGNSANYAGGGIYCMNNSNPCLENSILWNDLPNEISGSAFITYSDIQGGWTGIGNIDEDPLFMGAGGYPFSLLEDSPCIDDGNPDQIFYDPEDPTNPGFGLYPAMGTIINDMGAYGGPNANCWPPVDIEDNVIVQIPETFLHQNYPNPFNPSTTINYSLIENSKVSLNIYNIKGQKVKQLVRDQRTAGQHSVIWNGRDDNGKSVSSGIYFYKLITDNFEKTKKMILMK